jgi:hypothetical protein
MDLKSPIHRMPANGWRVLQVARAFLGESAMEQAVDDLLDIQAAFATERTWCQPSPVASPDRVRAMEAQGRLTPQKRAEYRAALDRLRRIEGRHRAPGSDCERELHRIARWVIDRWGEEDRKLLDGDR